MMMTHKEMGGDREERKTIFIEKFLLLQSSNEIRSSLCAKKFTHHDLSITIVVYVITTIVKAPNRKNTRDGWMGRQRRATEMCYHQSRNETIGSRIMAIITNHKSECILMIVFGKRNQHSTAIVKCVYRCVANLHRNENKMMSIEHNVKIGETQEEAKKDGLEALKNITQCRSSKCEWNTLPSVSNGWFDSFFFLIWLSSAQLKMSDDVKSVRSKLINCTHQRAIWLGG